MTRHHQGTAHRLAVAEHAPEQLMHHLQHFEYSHKVECTFSLSLYQRSCLHSLLQSDAFVGRGKVCVVALSRNLHSSCFQNCSPVHSPLRADYLPSVCFAACHTKAPPEKLRCSVLFGLGLLQALLRSPQGPPAHLARTLCPPHLPRPCCST